MQKFFVSLFLLLSLYTGAQTYKAQEKPALQLKRFNIGYRWFEADGFGNNALTFAPLLKDPAPYVNYINSLSYNSLHGNPAPQQLHDFFVNGEWFKTGTPSRFWKRHTLQAGLLVSSKYKSSNMAIGQEGWRTQDTSYYRYFYNPTKILQFAGGNAGINSYLRISKKLRFVTGLHVQGTVAIQHIYKQQWDSSVFHSPTQTYTLLKTTNGAALKGKNYFQWQAFIPLALEMAVYKQQFFVRAELDAGIIGGRFQSVYQINREANALGVWLIYQRK